MPTETAALAVLTPENLKRAKAVLSVVRKLGNRNNELADAANREALDDIALDTARGLEDLERVVNALMDYAVRRDEWQGIPEHEWPTEGDVITRAEQYALATLKAGSHGKRKILWNAFFSSFKPDFYRDGWSTHLWNIAEQVEYPECRWLAEHSEKDRTKGPVSSYGEEAHFFADRLASLGLVYNVKLSKDERNPKIQSHATDVGRRFKKFVWDEEMGRDEKPVQ